MRIKKVVDSRTAEGRKLLAAADRYAGFGLSDVYKRFSRAKMNAFKEVYDEYRTDAWARDFRITSANSFAFCVAWCSVAENGNLYIRYITPKYDYWIF